MKMLRSTALALSVVIYALVWTPFAMVMAFAREVPQNWTGWTVVIANPLFLALGAGLFCRYLQKGKAHG